jgi:hypothetical protein
MDRYISALVQIFKNTYKKLYINLLNPGYHVQNELVQLKLNYLGLLGSGFFPLLSLCNGLISTCSPIVERCIFGLAS